MYYLAMAKYHAKEAVVRAFSRPKAVQTAKRGVTGARAPRASAKLAAVKAGATRKTSPQRATLIEQPSSSEKKRLEWIGFAPSGQRNQPDVAAIRVAVGLSQAEFGRMAGYSMRSVASWEAGEILPTTARRKVTEAARLLTALSELMPARAVGSWLREPNGSFGDRAPINLIEHGQADELWQMIHQIDANVAN